MLFFLHLFLFLPHFPTLHQRDNSKQFGVMFFALLFLFGHSTVCHNHGRRLSSQFIGTKRSICFVCLFVCLLISFILFFTFGNHIYFQCDFRIVWSKTEDERDAECDTTLNCVSSVISKDKSRISTQKMCFGNRATNCDKHRFQMLAP